MKFKELPFLRQYFYLVSIMLMLAFPVFSQTEPNPNSPTPILVSQPDSTRALAVSAGRTIGGKNNRLNTDVFDYYSKVILYVTNLDLSEGEDAGAFRVYIQDQNKRKYRFSVLNIEPVKDKEWVSAVTVGLKDEIGFWTEKPATGDVLVQITWRGLASNKVKLGLGATGGKLEEDADAKPTPFPKEPLKNDDNSGEYAGYKYSGDRIRFLEQATFGATPELDQRLRRIGLFTWLAEQFDAPYPSADNPYPNLELKPGDAAVGCPQPQGSNERRICTRDYYSMYPMQTWFSKEALYGTPQLRHKTSWALSQIWVVSGFDTQQASWMIDYHQDISKNAFGNYRQLMKDMTLNAAMGNYLDMARSTKNSPNENYAREIMQLFTVGLFMMNQDGTLQLDSQGRPIPTYTQETVNNLTKVLTGWTFCNTQNTCPNITLGAPNYKDPLLLNQNNHDTTAKVLLDYPNAVNKNISAGLNGNTEMDLALDNIFYHPNVAPFVSKLLIQQMVSSDPSPAYVGRVAAKFNNNGNGVRGDLKAVINAILLDPEARGDVKSDPYYGKLREPVQQIMNFYRQFNPRSADGTQKSDGVVYTFGDQMGQNPFYSPTVFNFYPPDYIVPGTSLLGPEFGIRTTGTAIGTANFVNSATFAVIPVSLNTPLGTSIDLSEMTTLVQSDSTGNQMLDTLNTRMLHGTMSASMKNKILTAVQAVPASLPQMRAQQAIYLIATSSQYQIQR